MNTIVAESLDYIATRIETEAGGDQGKLNEVVQCILQDIANESAPVVFGGNGYSEEWHAEAAKRGLPNLSNSVDAFPAMIEPEAIDVMSKYGVLSERETEARYDIALETYARTVNTEALLVLEMAKTMILPAALSYQAQLAGLASSLKMIGKEPNTKVLDQVIALSGELEAGIEAVESAMHDGDEADEDLLAHAKHFRDHVIPAMLQTRAAADGLEGVVSDELWPLPTYQEMLFIK